MARKKHDEAPVFNKATDPICGNCKWVSTWQERHFCNIKLPPHLNRAAGEFPRFVSTTNSCSFFKPQ